MTFALLGFAVFLTPSIVLAHDVCKERIAAMEQKLDAGPAAAPTVEVSTGGDSKTVPAVDAQPTENWFGNPPARKTAEKFIDLAKAAHEKGDREACLEQVASAESALNEAGKSE